jgi:hypothetical protein
MDRYGKIAPAAAGNRRKDPSKGKKDLNSPKDHLFNRFLKWLARGNAKAARLSGCPT